MVSEIENRGSAPSCSSSATYTGDKPLHAGFGRRNRQHPRGFPTEAVDQVLGVLFDEVHEFSKNSKASRIIGQLRGGMLPNPESFLAFITTHSDGPPSGAFKAELQTARAIRDGRANGRLLPVLFEFPMAIVRDQGHPPAWQDPVNWPMVTPNNGCSITIPPLVEDFEMAKLTGDEEIRR
jgi:phage terminase large subunit-like protein